MANIVYNSDFQKPLLNSGDDLVYTSMTSQQASDFYWVGTGNTSLNRDMGYFDYPTPPTAVSSQ